MSKQKTVVVGMSGGVDSSVTALLLKEQGYNVIGLFMKNWEELDEHGNCPASDDFDDVVRVCHQIGIPYYSVNFAKEYWENVFSECIREYKLGYTPNPDILCNREIKFKVFFEKAMSLKADYLATGHYCRKREKGDRSLCLVKGLDFNKDQTYFLYTMQEETLKKVLFPLGGLLKSEVRAIAEANCLATAKKKDSVGICFIGKRNFKLFMQKYIQSEKGAFETSEGRVVGQHDGIAFYTIGQRKGLGIGGPGEAWFVTGKDLKRNVITVVQGEDHPDLYRMHLQATELSWVGSQPKLPFSCEAKTRYRQEPASCVITSIEGDCVELTFNKPQKAITSRQAVVFYDGDICLGGALIV